MLTAYALYWAFIYWNFYLFKERNQINTWNKRVEEYNKKQEKGKTKFESWKDNKDKLENNNPKLNSKKESSKTDTIITNKEN
ncbi:hypothetical protein [Chryseobacterium oryctis]|uniref:Uncharacterized protein n=1 Tax=Chryseobacterium oryctis TaxID=2952618 RepID=A0ABT3HIR9_9FLAO|nr:hypothetical protein [Chryseobacterium oryctis]MCW3159682.1 hypothetical protein [Chryseobacterium oryctis]